MGLGRRLAGLAVAATLLGGPVTLAAPAALASTADEGLVRCADLSPGTPQDVYLYPFGDPQHTMVLKHQGYGTVTEYMPVAPGQYTLAMRPVGAPASSPPSVSTSFMVSAGSNYTLASIGPASARRLKVLQDQMPGAAGSKVLVRVIQASLKQPQVTVSIGPDTLARDLAFGSATAYKAVAANMPTVTFTAPSAHTAMPVTFTAGSVHTLVVLDGNSGLRIDNLTDAAGRMEMEMPKGGAATGFGGTAPPAGPGLMPWMATLAAGLLLAAAGVFGLRRSRRSRLSRVSRRAAAAPGNGQYSSRSPVTGSTRSS